MSSLLLAAALSSAPDPAALTLHLEHVQLLLLSEQGTTVSCRARWENTGAPLTVTTGFQSVFDGVSLVGVDALGREVVRQSAVYHQSPFGEPSAIPLGTGATAGDVVFSLDGVSMYDIAKVRLEGGVMGHPTLSGGFVTEWMVIDVFR